MKRQLERGALPLKHDSFADSDGPFIIVLAIYLASTVAAVAGLAIALAI